MLCIARENASWGYHQIHGALANLGYIVAPNTVKHILRTHGIELLPERQKRTSWMRFLKAHGEVMAATDLFTIEVWSNRGLATYYVPFVMHRSTRCANIAAVTAAPNGAFMKQVVRNLTDVDDSFLLGKTFLIMERDTRYTEDFRNYLDREGVKPVRCPARAPNPNPFAERFHCRNRLGSMPNFY